MCSVPGDVTHRCRVGTAGDVWRVAVTVGQLAVYLCRCWRVKRQAVIRDAALCRVVLRGKSVRRGELGWDSVLSRMGVLRGESLRHCVCGTAGLLVTLKTSMHMKQCINPLQDCYIYDHMLDLNNAAHVRPKLQWCILSVQSSEVWWSGGGIWLPYAFNRPLTQLSHLTDDERDTWILQMNRLCVAEDSKVYIRWDSTTQKTKKWFLSENFDGLLMFITINSQFRTVNLLSWHTKAFCSVLGKLHWY